VRVRGPRSTDGARCRPDSNLSPRLAQGEDDPNRRDPPTSEREREGRGSRPRGRIGLGERERAACGGGNERGRLGWAAQGERKKKRPGQLGRAGRD
jgi:hypothetical protein